VLRRAAFGSGGPAGTSTSFRLKCLLGQASAIGEGQSGSFRLRGGFWHAPGEVILPAFTTVSQVSPTQGGTLTAPNGRVQVAFPPGAVAATVTVTYTQRLSPAMFTGGLPFAGSAFALEATGAAGEPVTQFGQPFALTLHYVDPDWQGAGISAESRLNLYHWSAASRRWLIVPRVSHDPEANVLRASLDHLTEFALLGGATAEIYLPVILKGY
jgi:hypothetical protein